MNHSLNTHFAQARQREIARLVSGRRIADQWQPAPPGRLVDRMGKSLVHLGARLISDRHAAQRIENELHSKAA
jgi:hypothetical protein